MAASTAANPEADKQSCKKRVRQGRARRRSDPTAAEITPPRESLGSSSRPEQPSGDKGQGPKRRRLFPVFPADGEAEEKKSNEQTGGTTASKIEGKQVEACPEAAPEVRKDSETIDLQKVPDQLHVVLGAPKRRLRFKQALTPSTAAIVIDSPDSTAQIQQAQQVTVAEPPKGQLFAAFQRMKEQRAAAGAEAARIVHEMEQSETKEVLTCPEQTEEGKSRTRKRLKVAKAAPPKAQVIDLELPSPKPPEPEPDPVPCKKGEEVGLHAAFRRGANAAGLVAMPPPPPPPPAPQAVEPVSTSTGASQAKSLPRSRRSLPPPPAPNCNWIDVGPHVQKELKPPKAWEQLRNWLKAWKPRDKPGSSKELAVTVTGPIGVGKSTGVRFLAKKAFPHVVEYDVTESDGRSFMENLAKKQRNSNQTPGTTVVICNIPEPISQVLKETLLAAVQESPSPVILVVSEGVLSSKDALCKSCLNLPIRLQQSQIAKTLQEVAGRFGSDLSPSTCELIASTCNGDLRRAVAAAQLLSAVPNPDGSSSALPQAALGPAAVCQRLLALTGCTRSFEEIADLLALDETVPELFRLHCLAALSVADLIRSNSANFAVGKARAAADKEARQSKKRVSTVVLDGDETPPPEVQEALRVVALCEEGEGREVDPMSDAEAPQEDDTAAASARDQGLGAEAVSTKETPHEGCTTGPGDETGIDGAQSIELAARERPHNDQGVEVEEATSHQDPALQADTALPDNTQLFQSHHAEASDAVPASSLADIGLDSALMSDGEKEMEVDGEKEMEADARSEEETEPQLHSTVSRGLVGDVEVQAAEAQEEECAQDTTAEEGTGDAMSDSESHCRPFEDPQVAEAQDHHMLGLEGGEEDTTRTQAEASPDAAANATAKTAAEAAATGPAHALEDSQAEGFAAPAASSSAEVPAECGQKGSCASCAEVILDDSADEATAARPASQGRTLPEYLHRKAAGVQLPDTEAAAVVELQGRLAVVAVELLEGYAQTAELIALADVASQTVTPCSAHAESLITAAACTAAQVHSRRAVTEVMGKDQKLIQQPLQLNDMEVTSPVTPELIAALAQQLALPKQWISDHVYEWMQHHKSVSTRTAKYFRTWLKKQAQAKFCPRPSCPEETSAVPGQAEESAQAPEEEEKDSEGEAEATAQTLSS